MSHILVVDDEAVIRELIAAVLHGAGHVVACAGNGREGLAAVHAFPPDLIILDINMPEMDGLTMLRKLQALAPPRKFRVLLLTGLLDKQRIMEAAKLGVSGCILKNKFSVDDLMARVRQNLDGASAQIIPKNTEPETVEHKSPPANETADPNEAMARALGVKVLLTRDECLERAQQALHGKALSGVVAQVIQLATTPLSNATQLGESISHDPILSAKVLRVANSTAYATSRGPVTTVFDAIKKIGFAAVRNIAATVGIIDAMPSAAARDGFDPIRSWQHSFAVAMLAERFVAAAHDSNQSAAAAVAYLAGLCHDLGEILFQTCFGEECRQIQEAHARTGHPLAELEKVMLGTPTSELIGLTMASLSLPDAIRGPIEIMHGPNAAKDPLGCVLLLADIYANGMLLAASPRSPVRGFATAECDMAMAKKPPPSLDREKIRAEIFALTMLLSRISDPHLMDPLFPPGKSTVWLARESMLSKLDPVEVALESLAKVKTASRLPTPEEAKGIKALVIESADAALGPFTRPNLAAVKSTGGANLPILWLVHKNEIAAVAGDSLQPMLMPTPLETLARFISDIK